MSSIIGQKTHASQRDISVLATLWFSLANFCQQYISKHPSFHWLSHSLPVWILWSWTGLFLSSLAASQWAAGDVLSLRLKDILNSILQ